MAQTLIDGRSADRTQGPQVHNADDRGGGGGRGVPTSHAAAAGRLPVRATGDDPAPDAVLAPPLPATSWHQPAADVDGDKPVRAKFKSYPIGYFHVDLAEVRTEQGTLYLLVAIDRTSKFAFVELHEKATRRVAADFLRHFAAAVPYRIHTVLTDNGPHFIDPTYDG